MAKKTKIEIPNFSYPFKLTKEEEYNSILSSAITQEGIDFRNQALTTAKASDGIKAIADGELVAYRATCKFTKKLII